MEPASLQIGDRRPVEEINCDIEAASQVALDGRKRSAEDSSISFSLSPTAGKAFKIKKICLHGFSRKSENLVFIELVDLMPPKRHLHYLSFSREENKPKLDQKLSRIRQQ